MIIDRLDDSINGLEYTIRDVEKNGQSRKGTGFELDNGCREVFYIFIEGVRCSPEKYERYTRRVVNVMVKARSLARGEHARYIGKKIRIIEELLDV